MSSLTTTGSSQSQTVTQSPQAAVQPLNTGTPSSNVQPGTATALLNNRAGIALNGGSLSTVNLAPNSDTQTSTGASPASPRHINVGLFGVSIVLCLAAIALFWITSRTAKSTTV